MIDRRTVLGLLAGATTSDLLLSQAQAQAWPAGGVKVLVPFAAGGNTDTIARLVSQALTDKLGQPFTVENRPGANGALACDAVARAEPNGLTMLVASVSQIAVLGSLTKVNYDSLRDFAPITNIGYNPLVFAVSAKLPVKNLKEFVAYVKGSAKTQPYASGGAGSIGHLATLLWLKRAGLEMDHVPYRGGGPAIADLIAGHVPAYFANLSEGMQFAKSDAIRLLAISDTKRSPLLPDVPTMTEAGFDGFRVITWNGLLTRAGTAPDIIARTNAVVKEAIADPSIRSKLDAIGVTPLGDTPAEFAKTIAADSAQWDAVIKQAGITL